MTWENFADEVGSRAVPRRHCPVCKLIQDEGPEAARALEAVFANPEFSTRAIYDAIRARGHQIGREKVALHRRGGCL